MTATAKTNAQKIGIGSTVLVKFESGEVAKFTIVHSRDTDPGSGAISSDSPLGAALIGKTQGEKAAYAVNGRVFHSEIMEVF